MKEGIGYLRTFNSMSYQPKSRKRALQKTESLAPSRINLIHAQIVTLYLSFASIDNVRRFMYTSLLVERINQETFLYYEEDIFSFLP